MDTKMSTKKPINFRDDFKDKMKTWFQNKGILNRLELYLKNQMIVEFQRSCGLTTQPQNTTLSPKIQAVKVLIADFLLQEDLLFSLSVYCTEVPFLLNLTRYNQYVSHLADPKASQPKTPKPKFTETELLDVLEALNLNLKSDEFSVFYNIYKSGKTGSLLASLLGTIPKLIKKHRTLEYLLKRARKREKQFQKLLKNEKVKLKSMYEVVQKAYGVVEKHKSDMKELLQRQNNTTNSNELMKKENELTTWQKMLELKENSLEKSHRNKLQEIEDRAKTLERREIELQSKYQILYREMDELKVEREHIERAKLKLETAYVGETDKLQEFQRKFHSLQAEVQEMLETYGERRQLQEKAKISEHLAASEIFSSMEEYATLMEKENTLLKLSSNEQRHHISHLTNEIVFLRSRLDHLEKEMRTWKNIEWEIQQKQIVHALLLSSKPRRGAESERDENRAISRPSSRRKLFGENEEITQPSEFSSSSASRETNLTDEIVADAKNKVKELENESEVLNRNFQNLQNILTRNIALSESKNSSVGGSSPRLSLLSRSYSDLDSPGARKFVPSISWDSAPGLDSSRECSPRSTRTPLAGRRSNSFRALFMKRKRERNRSENAGRTAPESECSSVSTSPREKVNDDAEVRTQPSNDEIGEMTSDNENPG